MVRKPVLNVADTYVEATTVLLPSYGPAIAVVWFGAATWLAIRPDATLTLAVLAIALLPPAFALLWLGAGREDR